MHNGGGGVQTLRECIRPHHPLGVSSARAKDMATMVVDTAAEAAVMMSWPSVVVLVVLPMEDLACYDDMDRLVVLCVSLEWV